MKRNIFVGNLSRSVSDERLRSLFEAVGAVEDARVMFDRATNEPRGFAFVTMRTEQATSAAIERLDGHALDGRNIVVNEARPKTFSHGPRR